MYKIILSQRSKQYFFRFLVFGVIFQTIIILCIYEGAERLEESAFHDLDPMNNYMNVCSLPVYDYWHPKVMRYVNYDFDTSYDCDRSFKPFTELRNGSWRIVDEREGMNCSARCFERLDNWSLKFSDWMQPGPVSCEFLEAVCWNGEEEVYGYIHTQIRPKKPNVKPKFSNPPNVFVFLLDSLSTGSAKRSLPKTIFTMNSRLEAVEFPFVNKVGENSLPNGIALFFGKLIEKIIGENYGGENIEVDWDRAHYCNNYLNFSIMEEFRGNGYMTLYSDDLEIQVLNHPHCNGLKDAPTDHYMHPFYLNYHKYGKEITKKHLEGHLCREHRHPAYEYFQDFMNTYTDKPKFTWTWLTTLGHDLFNGFLRADQEMVEIIEKNFETFENSFVIILGDHGFRLARQRFLETDIGGLELHNPYLSISIPKKLRNNRELLNIMKDNSQKLQTHFDTRATLLDILKYQPESGFSDRSVLNIPYERGHSYLRRQPSFPRTCGRLPIPPEYCICQVEKTAVTDENLRYRFGNVLINHINQKIHNAEFSSMCEKYELKKVISLKHHGHLNHFEPNHNYEIIVMTTAPIYAQFQTILMHNKENNKIIFGNIMRMDRYGKTGDFYDYWHPKVMRYVDYHFDPTYGCDKNFKPYTELVNGSWRIVGERKGMNCWARCFENFDDWHVNASKWMKPGPVSCEFLEAVCLEDKQEIYGYIHSQIIAKEPKTEPKYPNLPNVFIFMMDSLSTGAAKRSLPRTLSTLSSRLDAIEFPFVNKVGENSLPNGISLFFGKAIEKINGENYGGDNVEAEWNKTEYCDSFVNNSILEEFQEHGYITQSIDDWAQQMVMFPNCKGFDKAPTDHYMHPFYMIYEKRGQKITKQHLKGHLCREPRHPAYEYLQEFIDTYKDEPKFSFSWISTTGHNHFNGFMRVDNEMVDIIERNMKTFENSFVILMGDHGYRMARQKFMETDIGSLELNNPYLSISIPKKLRKNLELLNIMKDNSQKLQTHFDTRATLLDILKYQPESGFSNRSVLNIPYERGHSYLRRQPSFPRTCGRLPIPPEYCICQVEKVHIPDESLQSRFGNLLINHINNLMFNANFSSICQTYYLGKVISLKHHGHLNHSEPNHNYEIIVMTTAPIYAQFQTILMHNKENNEVIFGNIMRMDRYGKTGDCTKSDQFQKMCFCKNLSFYDKMEYLVKKQLREWQVIIEDMFPRIG